MSEKKFISDTSATKKWRLKVHYVEFESETEKHIIYIQKQQLNMNSYISKLREVQNL